MHKGSKITTVVEDEIEVLPRRESLELLLNAPVVLLFRLALPRKDGCATRCNGSRGVVLS